MFRCRRVLSRVSQCGESSQGCLVFRLLGSWLEIGLEKISGDVLGKGAGRAAAGVLLRLPR